MLSSRDPSRIVPLPSPVSRPYDLLCFVLYGAQNQTLPETPPLAAPRITVVGSYATGLTMKIQRLPSTEADFRDVLSGWLFWAFAQHRSASASAVFAARIASSTPSSRDSIWNGKPAPSTYLHKLLDVTATRNILYIFQKWVMMSAHNRPMLPAATRVHGARLVDALDEVGRGGSSNSRLPWGSPCLSARGGLV